MAMKKKSFIILLLLLVNNTFSQKPESIDKLIAETNRYLKIYDELNNLSYEFLLTDDYSNTFYSLYELGLTQKDIKEYTVKKDTTLSYQDSINLDNAFSFTRWKIIINLTEIITHRNFIGNNLTQLQVTSNLRIIKSEDSKFYNFVLLDCNRWGCWTDTSMIFYVDYKKNIVIPVQDSIFNKDGYTSIDTFETLEGVKYLFQGNTPECRRCDIENYIMLVKIQNDAFVKDFASSLTQPTYFENNGAGCRGELRYNNDNNIRTISVIYTTYDTTDNCSCGNSEKYVTLYPWDEEKDLSNAPFNSCECVFTFNGKTFEPTKSCWERLKEENTSDNSIPEVQVENTETDVAFDQKYFGFHVGKQYPIIQEYPFIADTALFLKKLIDANQVRIDGTITHYKKIKLYGSNNNFILLEYNYHDGAMASYPWKFQFLFTVQGKLLAVLDASRFELLNVFPKQNPLLLAVFVTGKGNGCHALYKISSDTLENVYDGFSAYFPRTYDEHSDKHVNEPYELNRTVKDINKDGYNDLIFSGNIIYNQNDDVSENPSSNIRIPVKYIFLYNPKTRHFEEKEDYSKKYLPLDEGIYPLPEK